MRRKEGSELLSQQLCLILEKKMVHPASNKKKKMGSQGARWGKPRVAPLNVKEVNVPREK